MLLVLSHLKYPIPFANQIMFVNEFEILLMLLFSLLNLVVVYYMTVQVVRYYSTILLLLLSNHQSHSICIYHPKGRINTYSVQIYT